MENDTFDEDLKKCNELLNGLIKITSIEHRLDDLEEK